MTPHLHERFDRRAWTLLLVVCGAVFLDGLDVSMVGVALPEIGRDLDMANAELQWVISGYILGYGGFLLLGGRVADLYGRRRVFLAALIVFAAASLLGGIAADSTILIATRFLKGLAAAFTAPAALSILTTSFPDGHARNRALGVYAATGAAGFSSGLIIGGLLTELDWRLTFFAPVVLALLLLTLAARVIDPPAATNTPRLPLDLPGALLIGTAMPLLVFTIVQAPDIGWQQPRTLGGLVTVATLLTAFVLVERRTTHPIVRLGILRNTTLVRANLIGMSVIAGWIGFQFIATLYMQNLRGWTPALMAAALLPGGLIVATGSPHSARLVARWGTAPLLVTGMAIFVVAYLLSLRITPTSHYIPAILPISVLTGIGFVLTFGPVNMAATAGIPDHEQGLASGLLFTSVQFGGALSLAIATALMTASAAGTPDTPASLMDGYQTAFTVSILAATLGLLVAIAELRHQRRARNTPRPHEAAPLAHH